MKLFRRLREQSPATQTQAQFTCALSVEVDVANKYFLCIKSKVICSRVEIENTVWQGRDVSPEMRVRIFGEVARSRAGRYILVKSLTIVE